MGSIAIAKLRQVDRYTLGIHWSDGHESRYRLADLRRRCPCALCVDEWTREKTLDPATIDDDLVARGIEGVGRYALRIRFTDGHESGIYSYSLLRKIAGLEETAALKTPTG